MNGTVFDWKYEGHRIDAIISMDSLLVGGAGQNCIEIGYRAFFYDNETDGAVTLIHELSHVMEMSFEGCKADPFITEGFANYTVYRIAKYVNENDIECLKNVCSYIEHS